MRARSWGIEATCYGEDVLGCSSAGVDLGATGSSVAGELLDEASEFVGVRTKAGVVGATSVCKTFGISSTKGRAPQSARACKSDED
jgi:hypothetical protein